MVSDFKVKFEHWQYRNRRRAERSWEAEVGEEKWKEEWKRGLLLFLINPLLKFDI